MSRQIQMRRIKDKLIADSIENKRLLDRLIVLVREEERERLMGIKDRASANREG